MVCARKSGGCDVYLVGALLFGGGEIGRHESSDEGSAKGQARRYDGRSSSVSRRKEPEQCLSSTSVFIGKSFLITHLEVEGVICLSRASR